jgi:hypothetical protein
VSLLTARQRARTSAAAALTAAVLAGVPTVLLPAARADTSASAGAKVQTLLAKVHRLQA